MSERAFYPSLFPQRGAKSEMGSGAFLDRDLVEAMPVEPYNPSEIDRELPPAKEVEVRLVKKEALGWRRRHIEVVDKAGSVQRIFVGYSHPDARDEVVVSLMNQISGKQAILFGPKFNKLGAVVAPFTRFTFQSAARDTGSGETLGKEFVADVYPLDEKHDPFARAGFLVVAKTAVIQERVRRLAERVGHMYPDGAQDAWDEYVDTQFDLAIERVIPLQEERRISPRVREQRCPAWMRFVSMRQAPYAHEHGLMNGTVELRVPFVDGDGRVDIEVFDWLYTDLAKKQPGDKVFAFIPREQQEVAAQIRRRIARQEAEEAQRRAEYDLRRNTISPYVPSAYYASEQPFLAAVGGGLTNDKIRIPQVRPKGVAEWSKHDAIRPLRAVEEQNWDTMLKVAEGTYHRDLDRLDGMLREKREGERRQARKEVLKSKMVGECIDLKLLDEVTRVDTTFGERFLIEGSIGGKPTYIVDSPNAGVGLYVFHRYDDAWAWAQRKINFAEARRRAKAFIVHDKGWEDRVRAVLRRHGQDASPVGDGGADA